MTAKQRAAAKHRKILMAKAQKSAPRKLGPIIDYSNQTDLLDSHIESGRMVSIVTFYKLKTPVPGKFQYGMMQAGATVGDAFDMICLMRRSMMETMGFKEPQSMSPGQDFEFAEVEPVAREGVHSAGACRTCGKAMSDGRTAAKDDPAMDCGGECLECTQ